VECACRERGGVIAKVYAEPVIQSCAGFRRA
jgi:hypothetical protein